MWRFFHHCPPPKEFIRTRVHNSVRGKENMMATTPTPAEEAPIPPPRPPSLPPPSAPRTSTWHICYPWHIVHAHRCELLSSHRAPCAPVAPAGAQLEALLPVVLLWPRGALRPTPPLCSCNLHARPRRIPCLSSVASPAARAVQAAHAGRSPNPLQPRRAVLWQQPQCSAVP